MATMKQTAVVVLLCMAMTACTTARVVADGQQAVRAVASAAPAEGLKVGEPLQVTMRDGSRLGGQLDAIEADALLIATGDGKQRRIAFEQIERIERREFNGAKTVGLVVGALVLLALAAAKSIGNDIERIGKH